MDDKIKVIRKNEHKTDQWSGGITTQLYIYPEDSEYSKLNFLYRISSAKVEVEESLFTHLPGINREIMILDGEIELKHENHHNIKLKKFEKDSFRGDWTTKSYGKVIDFNLMTNNECKGKLEHIKLRVDNKEEICFYNNLDYTQNAIILYIALGKILIKYKEDIELNEGDIFIITNKENYLHNLMLINSFNSESHVIVSKINFN